MFDINALKYMDDREYKEGYRLVYFKNGEYTISSYSKTLDGFAMELEDYNPYSLIEDNAKYTSIEDLLRQIIEKTDDDEIYIYSVDGTMISSYKKKKRIK